MWCKVGPNFILWVPVLGARTMAFSVWHFHFRSWALGSEGQQAWVSWLVSRGAVGASVFSVALCPRQSPIPQVGAGLKKGAPTSAAFGELSLSNRWLLQDDKWPVPPRKITLQLELKGEGALYSQLHQVARVSLLLNQMKVGVVRVGRTSLGSNTTSSLFLLSFSKFSWINVFFSGCIPFSGPFPQIKEFFRNYFHQFCCEVSKENSSMSCHCRFFFDNSKS